MDTINEYVGRLVNGGSSGLPVYHVISHARVVCSFGGKVGDGGAGADGLTIGTDNEGKCFGKAKLRIAIQTSHRGIHGIGIGIVVRGSRAHHKIGSDRQPNDHVNRLRGIPMAKTRTRT
eukprot:scaffold88662_cov31-Attheya_sp.AAC.1